MQTVTGRQYWPLDPRPEDVDINDIAHALSMLCRYNGHCNAFYSVAEHSLLVSFIVPPEHALVALLHDATEAYCADVPRPLKKFLAGYAEIEEKNWLAVAAHFGIDPVMPECVKAADNAVLLAEKAANMGPAPGAWSVTGKAADVPIYCWHPTDARHYFLERFHELLKP